MCGMLVTTQYSLKPCSAVLTKDETDQRWEISLNPHMRLSGHKRLRELHMPNCDSCVGSHSSTHVFLEGECLTGLLEFDSHIFRSFSVVFQGLYRNSSLTTLDLSMNRLDSFGALILEAQSRMLDEKCCMSVSQQDSLKD